MMTGNGTIVGSVYLTIGLFGVFENGLTAVLMASDPAMRSPTYIYMINMCISDMIFLLASHVYAGLAIMFPSPSVLLHPSMMSVAGYLFGSAGWCGPVFMALISFSRYIQLSMPEKAPVYFSSSKIIISVVFSWLLISLMNSIFLYRYSFIFILSVDQCAWIYNTENPLDNVLLIAGACFDIVVALLIIVFNLGSMLAIRKMRRQVTTSEIVRRNQKREVNLFIQCAITSAIFICAFGLFFFANGLRNYLGWYALVSGQIVVALNTVQDPIIYFALNTRLRRRFVRLVTGRWKHNG